MKTTKARFTRAENLESIDTAKSQLYPITYMFARLKNVGVNDNIQFHGIAVTTDDNVNEDCWAGNAVAFDYGRKGGPKIARTQFTHEYLPGIDITVYLEQVYKAPGQGCSYLRYKGFAYGEPSLEAFEYFGNENRDVDIPLLFAEDAEK